MNSKKTLRILQVSTYDFGGGAEMLAWDLFQNFRDRGHTSYLAVGRKFGNDPNVLEIPNDDCRSGWARFWKRVEQIFIENHHSRVSKIFAVIAQFQQYARSELGFENFDFPGTYRLLDLPPVFPDILHAHNLHGNYFDLRSLPWLSQKVPLIITLHDAWLLSGHCAHSFNCERWKTGCGNCPDLSIYPSVKRDATGQNWKRKEGIYTNSRLYIATPAQWLMKKVEQSMLSPAVIDSRRIPYGIDLSVFRPGNRDEVRWLLNLPQDRIILLVRANSIHKSEWKDFRLMRTVLDFISTQPNSIGLIVLALGADLPTEYLGGTEIRYIPYQENHQALTRYYQAADFYVHAARVDTFPLAILEALACGLPVVATAVGGIPEQVQDGFNGFLITSGDHTAMITSIDQLITNPELRTKMGQNAAADARKRFDQNRQVRDYLSWYQQILNRTAERNQNVH